MTTLHGVAVRTTGALLKALHTVADTEVSLGRASNACGQNHVLFFLIGLQLATHVGCDQTASM